MLPISRWKLLGEVRSIANTAWKNCSVMYREVRYHPLREEAQCKLSGQLALGWDVSSL